MRRLPTTTAAAAAVPLALTACSAGDGDADGTLTYWLWDSNQLPAYEECAEAFEQDNPEMSIAIEQTGWDDYWERLTVEMVGEEAPDVFVNHLAHYPQLSSLNQLAPIDDYVEADGIDLSAYHEGLVDLWVGDDGLRYGLPKDWDTVALFYNSEMLADSDLTEEDLAELEWNPEDGGTYEEAIAHLTVDAEGNRGDEPDFDPDNVEVYGFGMDASGGEFGQTEWTPYAFSTGWHHTDTNPWGTQFNYGDPEFLQTVEWLRSLIEKGYMPSMAALDSGVSLSESFGAGSYAMVPEGSWSTNAYVSLDEVEVGIAPTPIGPEGERASMFNGLADTISAAADDPEAAWQWVSFLASAECQNIVAEHAVVFPAIEEASERAEEAFAENGIDVSAFSDHVDNGTTHLAPITHHWPEVGSIMGPALDEFMAFDTETDALEEANDQINALFE
jgi:multiple sugar transport system substrate-binding protein